MGPMDRPCAHCKKAFEWPAVNCPYCRARQPGLPLETERPPARRWAIVAAAALLGLLVGLPAGGLWMPHGYWMWRQRSWRPPDPKAEAARMRVEALRRTPPEGYRLVGVSAVKKSGETPQRVVLVGVFHHSELHGARRHVRVGSEWAGQDYVEADAAALSAAERKALYRAQFPPSLVAVHGIAKDGGLVAERTEVLGHYGHGNPDWIPR